MCARFSQLLPREALEWLFGVGILSNLAPRYNLAPSQPALAVRRERGGMAASFLHWGLIPAWADDPAIAHRLINARAETLPEKPSFRDAFMHHDDGGRCLIPADGFYEWDKTTRQPHRFVLKDGALMAMAGLWAHNRRLDTVTFTIVTTIGNSLMTAIGHPRMPVLIRPQDHDAWLSPDARPDDLTTLMQPAPAAVMRGYMVDTVVNSPRNETPDCIAPVDGPNQGDLFA